MFKHVALVLFVAIPSHLTQAAPVILKNPVIAKDTTWKDQDILIDGKLTVKSGATLTVTGSKVGFRVTKEDADSWVMSGTAAVVARSSSFRSADSLGRQWNLEAHDKARVSFEKTTLSDHTGLRFHEQSALEATASNIQEIQLHDRARVRLAQRSIAYIVMFFDGDVKADLSKAALKAGESIYQTQNLKVVTGKDAQGAIETAVLDLNQSAVIGWQLDASDRASVTFARAEGIVLAPHLKGTFSRTITEGITGDARDGAFDFSKNGGPRFAYSESDIEMINLYLDGNVTLDFTGATIVNEANVGGNGKLTLGPKATLYADLGEAYEKGQMILNGTRLVADDPENNPSITADDEAIIRLIGVKVATPAHVFALDKGQVFIKGGGPWKGSVFEGKGIHRE